jgi:hypothetical protein
MEIKPSGLIMALCDEMFDRRAQSGKNWPQHLRKSSREKLQGAGFVEPKGREHKVGEVYYFTEAGLSWYLAQRPERKLQN